MPQLPSKKARKLMVKTISTMEVENDFVSGKSKSTKRTSENKEPTSRYAIQRNYNPMKLSDRQRRFVMEYCVDCKAGEAARRAGYTGATSVTAGRLLANPVIKSAIAKRQMFLAQGFTVKSKDVLRQLIYALTRDALDFCDKETGLIITDIRKLPPRARACIDGVEQEVTVLHDSKGHPIGQRVKTKLKLVPKAKAIEMAMQHKGLFKPTNASSEKVDVDWDKISADNQTNPVDEIVADPLKYLSARIREVEATVVEPGVVSSDFPEEDVIP